ncbi:hypothetical protein AAVH_32327 [Aphelenchoides avenae]|nr:hypothetical protein AAVH_32327 [Aphelenchus avenae]
MPHQKTSTATPSRSLPQPTVATPSETTRRHGKHSSRTPTKSHRLRGRCGANPALSEKEQRALDGELDSDNESCLTYGSPYAAAPYARPHSPSGGFGPHIGREDEAPEDFAPTAEDGNYCPDEPTSTAKLKSPSRHASETGRGSELGYHHTDLGPNAQQTSRGAVYEDRNYDYLYEDDYSGADLYEDHSYPADRYEDHVYGGDFYDDDSAY